MRFCGSQLWMVNSPPAVPSAVCSESCGSWAVSPSGSSSPPFPAHAARTRAATAAVAAARTPRLLATTVSPSVGKRERSLFTWVRRRTCPAGVPVQRTPGCGSTITVSSLHSRDHRYDFRRRPSSLVSEGPPTSGKPRRLLLRSGYEHPSRRADPRSEEHTSELQSRGHLVCRLLLE